MTTAPLPDDNHLNINIELLAEFYDIDEYKPWEFIDEIQKLIYAEIAALASQHAPEELTKGNRPSLMRAALRIALSDPSTETKADLDLAGVKATKPVTSSHFMNILHEFYLPFSEVRETLVSNKELPFFMIRVRKSITSIDIPDDEIYKLSISDAELCTFIQALKIFAASKTKSFLEEYRSLSHLSSPDSFAGLEADNSDDLHGLYATIFNDAVHCATLLHTSNKAIGFQIKRRTEKLAHGGTYVFSISATPIDPPPDLESKSFNELINNIQDERTATREGVVSNGQVAMQVIVKRDFIEDTARRG